MQLQPSGGSEHCLFKSFRVLGCVNFPLWGPVPMEENTMGRIKIFFRPAIAKRLRAFRQGCREEFFGHLLKFLLGHWGVTLLQLPV